MRILVVSQYFFPESFIINQLSSTLVKYGHQVVVLTGKPNYPDGQIFSGYKEGGVQREELDGVEIIRTPLRPRKSGGAKDLLLNYLSFAFSGSIRFPSLVKGRGFDQIFVFAPSPITSVIPAIVLKLIKRTHLTVWVQDLWPESLSATGFVKNKFTLRLVSYLVKGIYAFTDTLLVQSQAFIQPVTTLAKRDKIQYFPNFIDDMQSQVANNATEAIPEGLKALFETNFCLVFAGNIGKAQAIDTLISAADKLISKPEIKIVFVGKGSELEWAQQEVLRLKLTNVVFAGAFPVETMPSIFSHANVLLVSLKAEEIFSYTIPSKVQAYMSAGKPIIASLDGEAARVIDEAGAGLSSAAGDVDGLVNQIIRMFHMGSIERDTLGQNGREYFLEHFEMEKQIKKLLEIFQQQLLRGQFK